MSRDSARDTTRLDRAVWRKSSRSSGSGNGNCVEVAGLVSAVAVRDSKLPTEGGFPHLLVGPGDWSAFLEGVKSSDPR